MKRSFNSVILGVLGVFLSNSMAFATSASSVLVFDNQLMKIGQDLTSGRLPTALAMIALGVGCMMHLLGKENQIIHTLANVVIVMGLLVAVPSVLGAFNLYSVTF